MCRSSFAPGAPSKCASNDDAHDERNNQQDIARGHDNSMDGMEKLFENGIKLMLNTISAAL
jgi:hypothetical protein